MPFPGDLSRGRLIAERAYREQGRADQPYPLKRFLAVEPSTVRSTTGFAGGRRGCIVSNGGGVSCI